MQLFQDFFIFVLTPCNSVKRFKSFRETHWLHFHGRSDEAAEEGNETSGTEDLKICTWRQNPEETLMKNI
jgi:hypothetical protein